MPDTYGPEVRRRVMRSVKSSNTKPELLLRRNLWAIGMRGWRVNRTDLPGKPDIVFGPARVAIFVDGAFWHGHPTKYWQGRCGPYWDKKIQRNMRRDREVDQKLSSEGWSVVRAWDFEIEKDPTAVAQRVQQLVADRSPNFRSSALPAWSSNEVSALGKEMSDGSGKRDTAESA